MSAPAGETPTSASCIRLLVTLVDDRQPGYMRHAHAVARLCQMVGPRLGLDDVALEHLRMAALLHDAGLLRLPFPHIGSRWDLPAEERRVWETHPAHGARMVHMLGLPAEVATAVLGHHERLDGSGYPGVRIGTPVSMPARILGACDVFDGARSGCRGAGDCVLSDDEALDILRGEESSRFDQRVVSALGEALEDEREIGGLTGMSA